MPQLCQVAPFEVFNLLVSESVIILDCCASSGPLLQGATIVDRSMRPCDAVATSRKAAIDIFGPERTDIVILVHDDVDASGFAAQAADALSETCERVLLTSRIDLTLHYGFLFRDGPDHFPLYPNEIIEGKIFLGSRHSISQQALDDLGITHIVSVTDLPPPSAIGRTQLVCRIPDTESADLISAIADALPFIEEAIDGEGKVVIHCEQGMSRSAAVVMAYLMRRHAMSREQALSVVRAQRSIARPNPGFLSQLEEWKFRSAGSEGETRLHKRTRSSFAEIDLFSKEPMTREELNSWIRSHFSVIITSTNPEPFAAKLADMGDWLNETFDKSSIVPHRLSNDFGLVLEGVLTRRECRRIIFETEKLGFGLTGYHQAYRGNHRVQIDDCGGLLAEKLFQRIRAHLPARLKPDWLPDDGDYPSREGSWRPTGCNTRFRFSKYFPNTRFQAHKDDMMYLHAAKCTFLTVNIYLNDLEPEQQGRTRFFTHREGDPAATAGGVAGSLVIFKQEKVVHDGDVLMSGLKYLMRTDVIFELDGEMD